MAHANRRPEEAGGGAQKSPVMIPDQASTHIFYDGGWQKARSGQQIEVHSPATGEWLGSVASADAEDVDAAVKAAKAAFAGWRDVLARERADRLRAAAEVFRANADELAFIDAMDSGNPVAAMRKDVMLTADYFDYFAGLILELKGDTLPLGTGILNFTMKEPLGVVARIAAFNHPVLFVAGRVAAPLAAGNTVIVKPAEQTPLSAVRIAELIGDLFPPGVLNYVTGERDAGVSLVEHPGVSKVALIGSINAGRAVMRSAADTLKSLTLELGGKNAFIACDDADPASVAGAIVQGMNFASVAGQSCGSTSRIYVHEAIHDEVVDKVCELVSAIRVGLPTDSETQMGCLSTESQLVKTLQYVEIAKADGAKLLCGGRRLDDGPLANGYFVEPAVFSGVTDDMRIAREEVFGPIISILKWTDEADVMQRVNALDVGLTAAIWTRDISRGHRMAAKVEAGYVWVNDVGTHMIGMPFGGYKQSGIGKEEAFEEMVGYTRDKNIHLRY